ncbi:unnamed protein product [Brachionus calyciflorus]|uniref:NECAP PHear domain-containing protein n=1 Tax=Brachionus calyciflorus TaxID=104777 RepID=A0A814JYI9_9BILA|nr:unnamed protein product [Brachionus calyciflorus]
MSLVDVDYERVLLVKPEVFVYRIPPRTSNRAYRASEWKLDTPDWNGRLRIIAKGEKLVIKLEDKNSGELFAACPVDTYPTPAVENVSDSARYFVINIRDESGRAAFIGIGFVDRSDSFDFNVALQDHFRYLKKDEEMAKQPPLENEKKLDLSFKEGQTIKINIGKKTETGTSVARPRPTGTGMGILLPPPPGSKANTLPKPQTNTQPAQQTFQKPNNSSNLLLDFE